MLNHKVCIMNKVHLMNTISKRLFKSIKWMFDIPLMALFKLVLDTMVISSKHTPVDMVA